MTTNAAATVSPTATACHLLHNENVVACDVILDSLDREHVFAVAHGEDPQDKSMSFTISSDRITIVVHEPTTMPELDWKPEFELNLPLIEIVTRDATGERLLYSLGTRRELEPQIGVTRSGSDTDLTISINFDGSSTTALAPPDGSYCHLSWSVSSCPRSLRFASAVAPAGTEAAKIPLVYKPTRQDYQ
jgi:hypothetical protein